MIPVSQGSGTAPIRQFRAGDLSVLYVTDRWDAPYRYRCLYPAMQLRSEGVSCDIVHIDDASLLRRIAQYDAVVLFRLPWSDRVERLAAAARAADAAVLFDVDDLVFDVARTAELPFLTGASSLLRRRYLSMAERLGRTLEACDGFIGATPALARAAAPRGPRAEVFPNLLSSEVARQAARIHRLRRWLQHEPIIAYLSGSDTHDRDLALIAPVLARILDERHAVRLMLIGFLDVDPCLRPFAHRIIRIPYLDRHVYPWVVATARVNVAPLAEVNAFTDSKSALKFFEAGAIGLPTVATPAAAMRDAITHGVDGFLAADEQAWYDGLAALLDAGIVRSFGEAARSTVVARHTHGARRAELAALIASFVRTSARSDRPGAPKRSLGGSLEPQLLTPMAATAATLARMRAIVGVWRRRQRPAGLHREETLRFSEVSGAAPTEGDAPTPAVAVVMPIYNAGEDVRKCVHSVIRHAEGDWRLILIDDASTDADLAAYLKATAAANPQVDLVRNEVNRGFVHSANRGMRMADGRDVILLNSDTIVTPGLIGRLARCTHADERTGIVSPFTNNGTICSIPEFCRDNPLPEGIPLDEYAELIRQISFRRRPEIVTAVGFCMYVRAEVFERIGYFDEEHFGRGYGEENDFCERAKSAGFMIRLCDDVFIAHTGGASFGGETSERMRENAATLARLRPNYYRDVADFCRRNPARDLQENVRYHLARHEGRRFRSLLMLLHAPIDGDRMGGTELAVRELVRSLRLPRVVVAWPDGHTVVALEVLKGDFAAALPHRFPLDTPADFFRRRDESAEQTVEDLIDLFDVEAVHIHHLLTWPIALWRILRRRAIPYVFTIHDYYAVCPSWNLLNRRTGRRCPCHAADAATVSDCLQAQWAALERPLPSDPVALLADHRDEFGNLLANAAALVAPSRAAFETVRQRSPDIPTPPRIIGHGYDATPVRSPGSSANDPLAIALIGQIAYPAKGADAYLELMRATRELPVRWHLFGDVDVYEYRRRLSRLAMGTRISIHGRYQRNEILSLLAKNRIDVSVFLPACDESFCYTLSESWLAGVPAIVSNAGALPERMAETLAGCVVESTDEAAAVLARLSHDRTELETWRTRAAAYRHAGMAENAARHEEIYREIAGGLWVTGPNQAIGEYDRELFAAYRRALRAAEIAAPQQDLTHQMSWWYPLYRQIKPLVPSQARSVARLSYQRLRSALRRRMAK